MKTSLTKPSGTIYQVTINGELYSTTAKSPSAAISKCAYRYATSHGENVGLVQWKIREGKIVVEVEKR